MKQDKQPQETQPYSSLDMSAIAEIAEMKTVQDPEQQQSANAYLTEVFGSVTPNYVLGYN